jgi:hypothetical protein
LWRKDMNEARMHLYLVRVSVSTILTSITNVPKGTIGKRRIRSICHIQNFTANAMKVALAKMQVLFLRPGILYGNLQKTLLSTLTFGHGFTSKKPEFRGILH